MTTSHAQERVEERLTQAGWSTADRDKLYDFTVRWAVRTNDASEAVRVAVLPEIVGEVWNGQDYRSPSNGNEVWAIYRQRKLITVFLRRHNQPDYKLRCDTVNRLI